MVVCHHVSYLGWKERKKEKGNNKKSFTSLGDRLHSFCVTTLCRDNDELYWIRLNWGTDLEGVPWSRVPGTENLGPIAMVDSGRYNLLFC